MAFERIPAELRAVRQWINWRYEDRGGKPTKVPLNPSNGYNASVTDPETWSDFDSAVEAASQCDGIGFVFSPNDPYCGIDLDATSNSDTQEFQNAIFERIPSYAEYSPSGKGCHVICRAAVTSGKRKGDIELYSSERFFTMTGNVIRDVPIIDAQPQVAELWAKLGGSNETKQSGPLINATEATQDDNEVIQRALSAANGAKLHALVNGDGSLLESADKSGSVIDQAIVNILQFYTKDPAQIERIWRSTPHAQKRIQKMARRDYVSTTIRKAFDLEIPAVDIEALRNSWTVTTTPPTLTATGDDEDDDSLSHAEPRALPLIPGLVGLIAQFIYDNAPRQIPEIAIAGALAYMSGLCGRSFNVSGTGLNQYILALAGTGMGKSAAAAGIDALQLAVIGNGVMPAASTFVVSGDFASGQAIGKHVAEHPSSLALASEFTHILAGMSAFNAPAYLASYKKELLALYEHSAADRTYRPRKHSDREKDAIAIRAPSFSLLGEGTPAKFYAELTDDMLSEGLLPRFVILEYEGPRVARNKRPKTKPSDTLVGALRTLANFALMADGRSGQGLPLAQDVPFADAAAEAAADRFERRCDAQADADPNSPSAELWSRTYVKMLKTAAILAVGEYGTSPRITTAHIEWADKLVWQASKRITSKFSNNEVGMGSDRCASDMRKTIIKFLDMDWDARRRYPGAIEHLCQHNIIQAAIAQNYCLKLSSFRRLRDPMMAINNLMRTMTQTGELIEIAATDPIRKGFNGKLYTINVEIWTNYRNALLV